MSKFFLLAGNNPVVFKSGTEHDRVVSREKHKREGGEKNTRGGRILPPLVFFFHHPETPQTIKLKLSDFRDTSLRHILQVIPVRYILRCYHGNKITKGTLQNLAQ